MRRNVLHCLECTSAKQVFVNTANEMIGGSYECKYTHRIHNGRSKCSVPLQEKRLWNNVRHMNCKHCDNERSYCNLHNEPISDIANGIACHRHIFRREE